MKKILIVDDDFTMRALLKETLEEFEDNGVEILIAEDGKEALEIIKASKPEFVILDIMMPEMNGIEVCNIVKNVLRLNNIYVLLLSAKSQTLDIQIGEKAGADNYMTKPFNPDKLCRKVAEVLNINN